MERRLIEAANTGDVDKLHNLINEYPFLLRSVALASGDTPLHIACMGGHVNFVKEVAKLRPEYAEELNQDGLSPLHIASANGDTEIVKELLKLGSHLCLVQGREKRIPFHTAVVKGRIQVMSELMSSCLDSITEVTARGETCSHLAVRNNQFKAFKVLCEYVVLYDKEDILNHKDEQGNTILHLAASRKQYEVVDLLLDKNFGYKGNLDTKSLNKNGLTPLHVLLCDYEIEEMLTLAGAVTGAVSPQNPVVATQGPLQNQSGQEQRNSRPKSAFQNLVDFFKFDRVRDSPSEARNTLLVMAVLIVTAKFSVPFNPPSGVWQDDLISPDVKNNTSKDSSTKQQPPPHNAGEAIMATRNPMLYDLIVFFNTLGLFTSMHMTSLLTLGFPLQTELKVAGLALGATYGVGLAAITPNGMLVPCFILVLTPGVISMLIIVMRKFKKGRRYASYSFQSTSASA